MWCYLEGFRRGREGGILMMRLDPSKEEIREEIPLWCSGLKIWHVLSCGVGCSCGSDLIFGLGNSTCCKCSWKKKREREERDQRTYLLFLLSAIWGFDKKANCLQTKKRILTRIWPLISDLPASRTAGNKCLLYKPPSQWYFFTATWAETAVFFSAHQKLNKINTWMVNKFWHKKVVDFLVFISIGPKMKLPTTKF